MNTAVNGHFCGIDFGTSNSTIGIVVSDVPGLVALEDGKLDMPSTIFFDDYDKTSFFGREAIERYIDGSPGRFMRSMKSVLGSSLMSTGVGSSSVQFERVIAIFLKTLKARAQNGVDSELTHAVLGRPVHFVDDNPVKDRQAQNSLEKAAKLAGFSTVSFQYEPIAAALAYESGLKNEELALIIDIGGGTSDFTLIKLSPQRGVKVDRSDDILGTAGVHVGGTDLDKQLSLKQVMPHFGYQAQNIHKPGMILPHPPFANFASWHLINTLYEKSSLLEIKSMRQDIAGKHLIDRFIKVIERREAHRVGIEVEAAKVGLSAADEVNLCLDFVEQGLDIPVNKAEFNHTIMASCDKVVASMHECLAQAGITPQKVGSVFLTGGTTSVELFRSKLVAGFAHAKIVDGDKFGSVGLGLTLHSRKLFAPSR